MEDKYEQIFACISLTGGIECVLVDSLTDDQQHFVINNNDTLRKGQQVQMLKRYKFAIQEIG